jgi:peptidyl-prolyl cis-trans isomerase SDCCAG10
MSNVYTLEPPTTGKVILVTNYGNIDIELWTKEAPKACKNFIQLCLEGYYSNCVFFRIIKGFMIQTGDPTNTGKGGESIWGKEFQDEFHSRLKFNHRGIVAMANRNESNSNSSQFFITMDKCPWLDKKHTIFGKITGDTFFNAMAISEIPTKDDFPITETLPILIRTEVLINPFLEIVPRKPKSMLGEENRLDSKQLEKSLTKFKQAEKMKNTNLISFDEDGDGYLDLNKDTSNTTKEKELYKIRPIHEIVKNDKKLVNKPVVEINEISTSSDKLSNLKNKIKSFQKDDSNKIIQEKEKDISSSSSESESEEEHQNNLLLDKDAANVFDQERKNEILQLKKDIVNIKKRLENPFEENEEESSKPLTALQKHQAKFLGIKKGNTNTRQSMDKLEKFREKLKVNKSNTDNWMSNKLKFHVDSQKAYAMNETKEKQMKSFDYNPAFK